jgi:hypothetical protein
MIREGADELANRGLDTCGDAPRAAIQGSRTAETVSHKSNISVGLSVGRDQLTGINLKKIK